MYMCIRLNHAGKYWDITSKIMVMLQSENCIRILEEEKHRQLYMFVILWKKWKKLASSSINQSVKSQKQCIHPRILPLRQKVTHQFIVVLNNWTFRRHDGDEYYIKTLVWRHTKFNWFRSWSQLSIQCVFTSLSGAAINLQKMPILAKNLYIMLQSVCENNIRISEEEKLRQLHTFVILCFILPLNKYGYVYAWTTLC